MKNIEGLDLKKAETLLEKENKVIRVAKLDGEPLILTCDYMLGRVNVEVENDKVVSIIGEF
jgi:Cys-tRNA synthase (O-phospho-L-seryl-tRNA:Cys-tRNA synthase)